MIACHSLHTHILCLIEHSLKDQLLNILFSSPLQCVALGLMCCIIQALLCKQIFYTSIFAACCSGTTVLLILKEFVFTMPVFLVCGKWKCAARLRSGLLCGFNHLWVCFPAMVLSMPLAPQPAQQLQSWPQKRPLSQPEDEKFKSVYEKGRNTMPFSCVSFSMKIGLRLSCLKLNLACLLPPPSVLLQTFVQ